MPRFLTDKPADNESNKYEVHGAIAEAIAKDILDDIPDTASERRIAIVGE